jgi:phosphoribosylamine--glycine ligase
LRILVIGSGGREHALVWKLAASPRTTKIYCAPGNPGIGEIAQCVPIGVEDIEALCQFALDKAVDLTVVGPELPLAKGIVDLFNQKGLKIFGPTQAAAQIEGSKAFAKGLMKKYGIPTAHYAVFTDVESAKQYVQTVGAPIVIKADGLAAGKGVVVAMTLDEALAAIEMMLSDHSFGDAGARVVIEEYMEGEEVSLLTFTDGVAVVPMLSAQDHKRVFDGDQGPNTGGMGAYAPAPVMTSALLQQVMAEIVQPTVDAMGQEGMPYVGCLYAGLMITATGPKTVEFNARFGDPETQVVLPLLASDLVTVLEACIDGKLAATQVSWKDQAAVCVVMAAGGYPGEYKKGDVITGISKAQAKGALVFHAGTAGDSQQVLTSGGRILGVTAVDDHVLQAINKAYEAVGEISFPGMHYRKDIAHRVIARLNKPE